MRTFNKPLPDTLHELLMVALTDLEKVEQSDKYEVVMSQWHTPNISRPTCSVCLAGSVMAMRDGLSPFEVAVPYHFSQEDESKLYALDHLRCGRVGAAFMYVYPMVVLAPKLYHELRLFEADCPQYYRDEPEAREDWWDYMLFLVGMLQEEGI